MGPLYHKDKTLSSNFSKEEIQMGYRHMKNDHHHLSSGKCKSKRQFDVTSHLSEWLKQTNKQTNNKQKHAHTHKISVGENIEKKNSHALLVQPLWKQYGVSERN